MIKLSIIMPAYNEEKTIIEILNKVSEVEIDGVNKEVIVIDDCSTDNTLNLLRKNKNQKITTTIMNKEKNIVFIFIILTFSVINNYKSY